MLLDLRSLWEGPAAAAVAPADDIGADGMWVFVRRKKKKKKRRLGRDAFGFRRSDD